MKRISKLLWMLALSGEASGGISYFKYDQLRKSHKSFRESQSFLQEKYRTLMEEIQKKGIALQEDQEKLEKKGKNASQKDKDAFDQKVADFEKLRVMKQQEMQSAEKLMTEQDRSEIVNAAEKVVKKGVLVDGDFVVYGGDDITKDILKVLKKEDVKGVDVKGRAKIAVFDHDKFSQNSDEAKKAKEFVEKKVKHFQERQKELLGKRNKKDFDEEAANRELGALNEEIMNAQQLMSEKLQKEVSDAASTVAKEKKLDLVLNKQLVFRGGEDITDSVLKELRNNDDKDVTHKSAVGYIAWEHLLGNYTKYSELKKRHEAKAKELEKDLESRFNKLQKMKDAKRSAEDIEKAEQDFGRERMLREQQLSEFMRNDQEKVLEEVKRAAKSVGSQQGYEVVIVKDAKNPGIYYGGDDVTEDILKVLNKK